MLGQEKLKIKRPRRPRTFPKTSIPPQMKGGAATASMRYKGSVKVMLKSGVLDPQGATLERALKSMGHQNVDSIRVGKLIELELESESLEKAEAQVEAWADELLANPVTERYHVKVAKAEAVK